MLNSTQGERASAQMTNSLSFDVEDYFQVSNFEAQISRDDWSSHASRVESNTQRILNVLAEFNTRSTFFILGWVADNHPSIVRAIVDAGHEVGVHSYWHRLIYDLSPEDFRADLRRCIDAVENVAGKKVRGHRAPSFSITEKSMWAIDIMQEEGLEYDTSVFPVHHHRYGIPDAPRTMYEIRPGFWEFPIATAKLGKSNFPIGGGAYFRLFPYAVTRGCLKSMHREGVPAHMYLHPWEFDPGQPRLEAGLSARIRHYTNLDKTEPRLKKLLTEFQFAPLEDLLPTREPALSAVRA